MTEGETDQLKSGPNQTHEREPSSRTHPHRINRPHTGVVLGRGKPDPAVLSSAISEWIVPVLVAEFLAEHPVAVPATEVNPHKGTSGVLDEEGAGSTCIVPNGR